MGNAFIQTTALEEVGPLDHDATNLTVELKAAMLSEQRNGPLVRSADGWTTDLRTCSFTGFSSAPENLDLGVGLETVITCTARRFIRAQENSVVYSINAVVGPDVAEYSRPLTGYHLVQFVPVTGNQQIVPGLKIPDPAPGDFFSTIIGDMYVGDENLFDHAVGSLVLHNKAERDFTKFYEATQGDPNAYSNNLVRMTYFSATTITTLGLGDIDPTADRSRALVAIEAVSGLIIIGLFVNSVAAKYGLGTTST
jgi:voltage-gated potassium channel Kch